MLMQSLLKKFPYLKFLSIYWGVSTALLFKLIVARYSNGADTCVFNAIDGF